MTEPTRIVVELTPRQERQLLAVADDLGIPLHEVGAHAIVAFLATYQHHPRGPERLPSGWRYDRKTNRHLKEDQ